MFGSKTLSKHAGLMGRMAETLDVDLGKAIQTGAMSPESYRASVMRCTKCSDPEACADWLDENSQSTATPDYCRNAAMLEALKP